MRLPDTPEDVAATFCATLVDEWLRRGVRHAVLAPGSRSTPLALALAARPELSLHVFHDERAAAFAALGIGLTGAPAILLCTSGTAAAHFHAAVIEAHQSGVPLIVCTADRPPELRDVGAPQTIDQTKLYGSSVRWFHDPGVASVQAAATWRSLAAHVWTMATAVWPGPVHLNLPFREPLVGRAGDLPAVGADSGEIATRLAIDDASLRAVGASLAERRGLVVAGRGTGDPRGVHALAVAAGWPVLADARSGARHLTDVAVTAADHLLRSPEFAAAHRPEIVLRIGEPPASKVLSQWLADVGGTQIHLNPTPSWIDPDSVVSQRIVADPADVCRRLADVVKGADPAWQAAWLTAEQGAQRSIDRALGGDTLTEPLIARLLPAALGTGSQLMVSSSMPIRDIEWFGVVPDGVTVHSNRGANGIDGVIATATGVAIASGATTGLLIGDVAFLHDSSALTGLARRGLDVRIVVIDNDGGGIFSFLPQATSLAMERFEQLFGTPHGTDLVALAGAHGLRARTVTDRESFAAAVRERGPTVIRIATDRVQNVAVHERLNAAATGG